MSEKNILAGLLYLVGIIPILGIVISIVIWHTHRHVSIINYHFKQWLVLLIAGLIASVISMIPFLGKIVAGACFIVLFILWIIAMIHAFKGEQKPIPIIGGYAKEFKF